MLVRCIALVCVLSTPLHSLADPPAKPRLDGHGFPLPDGALTRLGDLHFAQPGSITALALSPDDKLIATAGPRIFLWNADTGHIVREIGAPWYVTKLAFSCDGRLLAGATVHGDVIIWNVASGTPHWPGQDR